MVNQGSWGPIGSWEQMSDVQPPVWVFVYTSAPLQGLLPSALWLFAFSLA
jgi:hypothetical protein